MSKQELKNEIDRVLDTFSDAALQELLFFLKELDSKKHSALFLAPLKKILAEDSKLLARLAQ